MIRLRAIFWAIGVWTTAVSTLLAGLPHLQCHCPDGHIKPFCLSILVPSICCDRSCCADPAGEPMERGNQESTTTKPCCCCCQAAQQAASRPAEQIRSLGCQKTLTEAQLVSCSDFGRYSVNVLVFALHDSCDPFQFMGCELKCGRFAPSSYWSPPSSDLVIALRHLLI